MEQRGWVAVSHISADVRQLWTAPEAAQGQRLYVGCGPLPLSPFDQQVLGEGEWVLVDKFVSGAGVQPWDAQTLSEVGDGSVAVIYTSHMLEHVSHLRVVDVLRTWWNKLAVGGAVWICVPDLLWMAEEVVRLETTGHGAGGHYTAVSGPYGIEQGFYGSQHNEGEYHKSGFTETTLRAKLEETGFCDIRISRTYDAAHELGALFAVAYKKV